MLLFVLQTQLHELQEAVVGGEALCRRCGQQLPKGGIDAVAPGDHRIDRRTAQQPPLGAWMAGADGVVVAVEQVAPAGIGWLVVQRRAQQAAPGRLGAVVTGRGLQRRSQQEFLEEPGRVSQMPFGWAGISHALQAQVLRLERGDQRFAMASHLLQAGRQRRWAGWVRWALRAPDPVGLQVCGTHPCVQEAIRP